MDIQHLKGIFPALLTPLREDDSIDYESLHRHVKYLSRQGVHGFYVGGSTGEGMIMSSSERQQVLEHVIQVSEDKSIIAHVGSVSTDEAVRLATHAEQVGADAISAIVPYYYSLTEEQIMDHYLTLMKETHLPLIIYHFPQATGVSLSIDFYKKNDGT